ncbi:MAG: 6-pyruvoyl-tetrahydropterin synthase-related protein, partial [Chloroflexota bacterium]
MARVSHIAAPEAETSTNTVGQTVQSWIVRNRLLVLALVATFAYHAVIIFSGSFRGTYDAWVHIFFADHYARSWWNPWEPRWYTGFPIISYPPLSHQLTALLSFPFSLTTGFAIVLSLSTVNATLGVYRFCRLWVPERPASYAALLTVFSSSISETVHVFGQLPTMFVIGTILNALPFLWRWLEDGTRGDLFRSWALLMVACAGHHVTTVFGMVFFSGPIFATVLLTKFRTPRADEADLDGLSFLRVLPALTVRRIKRVLPTFVRCVIFGVVFIMIAVLTVFPYWIWSASDPITQITIPHGSRDSFLENRPVGFMFFVVPWGVLISVLPYAIYKGIGSKNWILLASLLLLSLLGTGGTTPIPAALLGGAFYILTLDRFTFWATIVIMPWAGLFVESLLHGRLGSWLEAHFGTLWRVLVPAMFGLSLVLFSVFIVNLTQFRKFQPAPLEMTPIVEFLSKDKHDSWRYMTLGFGDQLAWLSAQTTALNVEGNYHSARRLPEMTSTPIERLDGAKFQQIPGLGSLHQFIANPHKYNLKYIFVNDAFYEPLLHFAGWVNIGALENDVTVWER